MSLRVLVCDPIAECSVESMRRAGLEVDVRDTIPADELLTVIPQYEAMVVRSRTKVRKPVLDAATSLRVVVRGGVGVDNIDVDYAQDKGVRVLNTPAASSESVAELALAFMFALARPILPATLSLRSGQWEKSKFQGIEIAGKTLGIVGLGRIGSVVAQRASALGMVVLCYDICAKGPVPYMSIVGIDELLERADFISLHLPLNDDSRHMLNAATFAKMKKGVRIINCARGGIIDESDLYEAIKSGQVAGAALDVFEEEPLKDRRLFELPQVLGTPHIGASTPEATDRIGDEVAELLVRFNRENC